MGLRPAFSDVALASAARGAGTYTSGPVANAGEATDVLLMVHCTTSSGTPTLDASLEESADGSSWTAVAGSAITQLTAAGNRVAAAAPSKAFVRATTTVAGTTPSMTYRVTLLIAHS